MADYRSNMSAEQRASFDDAVANADARVKRSSGLSADESAALKYAKSTLAGAAHDLNPLRSQARMTRSEVRAIAASAAKGLPARMGEKMERAVLAIADDMRDGIRNDERIRELAFEAAKSAPEEFVDPDATDPNMDELSADEIAGRVRR